MIKNKGLYLTSAEIAKESKFSEDYIRKLINNGTIKAEKLGRNWIIRKDQIKHISRQRFPRTKDAFKHGIDK